MLRTIDAECVPLERALRRLVDGTSMVIVYEPLRDGGAKRIAEVCLYSRPRLKSRAVIAEKRVRAKMKNVAMVEIKSKAI